MFLNLKPNSSLTILKKRILKNVFRTKINISRLLRACSCSFRSMLIFLNCYNFKLASQLTGPWNGVHLTHVRFLAVHTQKRFPFTPFYKTHHVENKVDVLGTRLTGKSCSLSVTNSLSFGNVFQTLGIKLLRMLMKKLVWTTNSAPLSVETLKYPDQQKLLLLLELCLQAPLVPSSHNLNYGKEPNWDWIDFWKEKISKNVGE